MLKKKTIIFAASMGIISAAFAPAIRADYTVTDLGSLGGYTLPISINSQGQVVGDSYLSGQTGPYQAFLWQPTSPNAPTGSIISLNALSTGGYSTATDINSSGQIVGYSTDSTVTIGSTYLWTPSAPNAAVGSGVILPVAPLSVPGQYTGVGRTTAAGINDAGEVVADAGPDSHAALFLPTVPNGSTGSVTELAGSFYGVSRINSAGQFTRWDAAVGLTYQMSRFDPLIPGGTSGTYTDVAQPGQGGTAFQGPGGGMGINSSGVIAGYGSTALRSPYSHALIWNPDGSVLDLNSLLGATDAELWGINDSGDAVGAVDEDAYAFMYEGPACSI